MEEKLSLANPKSSNYWALKIFIITIIVSAGVSVVAEVFISDMGIIPALLVLLLLVTDRKSVV